MQPEMKFTLSEPHHSPPREREELSVCRDRSCFLSGAGITLHSPTGDACVTTSRLLQLPCYVRRGLALQATEVSREADTVPL